MIEHNQDERDEIAEAVASGMRPLVRCEQCGNRRLLQHRARRDYERRRWICDECLVHVNQVHLAGGRVLRGTASL